jgi:hypothetical protein
MPRVRLVCWKCGAPLDEVPLPLSRQAECPACRAWLHVCRLCEFYDPRLTSKCREERAEEVRDREVANFCDYFKPRPDAYSAAAPPSPVPPRPAWRHCSGPSMPRIRTEQRRNKIWTICSRKTRNPEYTARWYR